jgi:hypothetical protein
MNTDRYTLEELVALEAKSKGRRAEALRWAITDRLRQLREARGEKVNDAGYTGRQSKRR